MSIIIHDCLLIAVAAVPKVERRHAAERMRDVGDGRVLQLTKDSTVRHNVRGAGTHSKYGENRNQRQMAKNVGRTVRHARRVAPIEKQDKKVSSKSCG